LRIVNLLLKKNPAFRWIFSGLISSDVVKNFSTISQYQ